MKKKLIASCDLRWLLPVSLGLAALFARFENGDYAVSLLASWLLFTLGLAALTALWRWAGGGRPLLWMIALALGLRLVSAVALRVFLPINGYDNEQQRAGYVFFDAFRRDAQAWELAQSDAPILTAFGKEYYTDQYGGLLALSAGAYRYLSPDAQRPLLIALLGALAATLGVPILWRAAASFGDEKLAAVAAWIFALYPEGVLQASSQMREPFLMTFVAVALYGFTVLRESPSRARWWLGVGILGMLLFSPGIALITLLTLAGMWRLSREGTKISWRGIALGVGVFTAGLFLLAWALNRQGGFDARSPLGVLLEWMRSAVLWDAYQLERGSGWIQKLFGEIGESAQLVFVAVYGLTQPVLPAAFIEPTKLVWRIVAILRSLGWYAFMPLFFYGMYAAWVTPEKTPRRIWLWLGFVSWTWFALVSLRAGGDLWDNPRYRVILLAVQVLFAGYAWRWYQAHRDGWLVRVYLVEGVFLVFFTQWYASRYYHLAGQIPFWAMVAWICSVSAVIILGGWLRDRLRTKE